MKIKTFYQLPIKGYQYISKMLPASCRYYPTCSEYASWQFAFNSPHKALLASSSRILRCNPLFDGGIDYPLVTYQPKRYSSIRPFDCDAHTFSIVYWIVPKNAKECYILKDFDPINAQHTES
jgi:putative membrane protein insertion efficiency factor